MRPFIAITDCTICDETGGCGRLAGRFFRGVCPISNRATQFDTLSGSYGSGARNHALISKAHRPDKKGRSMVFYEGFVILHRPKSIPDFTKVNIRFLYGFLVKHPGQCS